MKELILIVTLIGTLQITSYRATKEQTDSTPFYTSTKQHVRAGGCAVSRDLLCGACMGLHRRCNHGEDKTKLHYGDWIYVDGYQYRQVNDVMGAYTTQRINGKRVRIPITRHIDIFVWTYDQEKAVNVKMRDVYLVESHIQAKSDPAQFDIKAAGTFKGGSR